MNADRPVTFAGFSLDLANERLVCDGEVVRLTSKAFVVLRRLVEHRGALVTKTGLVARFDLAAVRHPPADNGFRS
jgi:DNA-binding response OmpR family regulator